MKKKSPKKFNLTISLVLFVFVVLIATAFLTAVVVAVFRELDIISFSFKRNINVLGAKFHFLFPLLCLFLLCVLLGTTITAFLSKTALKPIRKVIDAIHQVAKGDFNVQVEVNGIQELAELSESFNKMTHELRSTETLRSDFVNNFSHEFKTPIVSIRGFAKLLRENHLSEEERLDYLDIIISESERLASLSTNVLSLSKYENMDIITDLTLYHLDEQIRQCILLLEPKWTAKNISINPELESLMLYGNEDILKQIWLNLIDNAIKFSFAGSCIQIRLSAKGGNYFFLIQDEGIGMEEDTISHIFDKFYQGDSSHSAAGNGLGLPMVKRILQLCNGTISVTSAANQGTAFLVTLPQHEAAPSSSVAPAAASFKL